MALSRALRRVACDIGAPRQRLGRSALPLAARRGLRVVQHYRDAKKRRVYHLPDGPSGRLRQEVHFDDDPGAAAPGVGGAPSLRRYAARNLDRLCSYFLPKGFPDSVSPNYLAFVKPQCIGYIAGSAGGVLSMQSLFYAAGLGSGSLPMAAALNWVMKDGLGQLGGVLFASLVNSRFDTDAKRFRMLSAMALDASILMEVMTPLVPGYFLLVASVANCGKNVSFLAASASRAAIHRSFAIRDNLADVTGKTGSQTIVTSMVGTGLGIALSHALGSEWVNIAGGVACMSFIHLSSTYMALSNVVLDTLNDQRATLLLQRHLRGGKMVLPLTEPSEIAAREAFMPLPGDAAALVAGAYGDDELAETIRGPQIRVGGPLDAVVSSKSDFDTLQRAAGAQRYLVGVSWQGTGVVGRGAQVELLLRCDAANEDVLLGFLHAHLVREKLRTDGALRARSFPLTWEQPVAVLRFGEDSSEYQRSLAAIESGRKAIYEENDGSLARDFLDALRKSSWNTTNLFLESEDARYEEGSI